MKKHIKIIVIVLAIVLCVGLVCFFKSDQDKKMGTTMTETEDPGLFTIFEADFSGAHPSDKQFYSWEGREYGNTVCDSLEAIKCENNTAILKSTLDEETGIRKQQLMCTAGLFESDDFVCEFEAKYSGKPGSWSYVITYGTGTYWTKNLYSDGIKWPAGGEIDVFEQAGGYSDNPIIFKTPSIHYGTGRNSAYPDNHLALVGENVEFKPDKWHKFKFSLHDGVVQAWIDGVLVGENDFSQYTVSNDYLYEYHPFLNPQAFYIECQSVNGEKSEEEYEFQIKNFKVIQEKLAECEKLEIYPQMWEKGTELVFPVNTNLYLQREYYPENTSNKACEWKSSDESVATVVQGYVTTLSEGTAEITATCGNATATYIVNVSSKAKIPCVGIGTEHQKFSLKAEHSRDIEYYLYPNFTTDRVKMSTEGEKIATLSDNILYGKQPGQTKLMVQCGQQSKTLDVTVKENKRVPFAEYDLTEVTNRIGINEEKEGYTVSETVLNTGEDGEKLDLLAEYSLTQELIENEWKDKLSGVTLKTPIMDEAKELTRYPSMYLLKASSGRVRTNNPSNANVMPSIDISDNGIIVRHGDVNIYQTEADGKDIHAIAIYIEDRRSSVFIDGEKVVTDGATDYINDLSQLILTSAEKNGIEYFAAYEDCKFTDEELIEMTQLH